MLFDFNKSIEILQNTPNVLFALLHNLSEEWTTQNEGENTWTVMEVMAHLIICEETNWLPRAKTILSDNPNKLFTPMDMTAHFKVAQDSSLKQLLFLFKKLRKKGIKQLKTYNLQEQDFQKTATHPVVGEVTLQQVIATWVSHDMTHLAQIARIIAKQNKHLVGSFKPYLRILG